MYAWPENVNRWSVPSLKFKYCLKGIQNLFLYITSVSSEKPNGKTNTRTIELEDHLAFPHPYGFLSPKEGISHTSVTDGLADFFWWFGFQQTELQRGKSYSHLEESLIQSTPISLPQNLLKKHAVTFTARPTTPSQTAGGTQRGPGRPCRTWYITVLWQKHKKLSHP